MSIIDKVQNEAIGTIELFNRNADDFFTNCAILRLDLRSDHETAAEISQLLRIIVSNAFAMFDCDKLATKAVPSALCRIEALEKAGFHCSNEYLIGHDGTKYKDYFVLCRETDKHDR